MCVCICVISFLFQSFQLFVYVTITSSSNLQPMSAWNVQIYCEYFHMKIFSLILRSFTEEEFSLHDWRNTHPGLCIYTTLRQCFEQLLNKYVSDQFSNPLKKWAKWSDRYHTIIFFIKFHVFFVLHSVTYHYHIPWHERVCVRLYANVYVCGLS